MLEQLKSFADAAKGWRTLILSAAIAVVGVLQAADWATIVPPQQVGAVMLVIGVVVAVLRTVTDTPLGKK